MKHLLRVLIATWLVVYGAIVFGILAHAQTDIPTCLMPPYEEGLAASNEQAMKTYEAFVEQSLFRQGLNEPDSATFDMGEFMSRMTAVHEAEMAEMVTRPFRILAVCVQFPESTSTYPKRKFATVPAAEFDTLIFGASPIIDYSVRELYSDMSHSRIDMVTINLPSSLGWIALNKPYGYYVNGNYGFGAYPQNTQALFEELVDLIDPLVDFSAYDNDGDGYVDGVVVIHPGKGAEFSGSTSDIWSHKWGITPRLKDGVRVSAYSIQPEYWSAPGDITIGVYAHEIGHLFGLPDLYDTDGSSQGLGRWSLMSGGSWNGALGNHPAHFDSWCLTKLGWATIVDVAGTVRVSNLSPSTLTDTVFRMWATDNPSPQYFLVNHRAERNLPSTGGLCLLFCDDAMGGNRKEFRPGVSRPTDPHYNVALVPADGRYDLDFGNNSGDAGDLWPGPANKTRFDAYTVPSSRWYTGEATGWSVSNITQSSGLISFDLCTCGRQGDLNADGRITMGDVAMAANQTFETDLYPAVKDRGCTFTRVDVNCDGHAQIFDVVDIRAKAQSNKAFKCAHCP